MERIMFTTLIKRFISNLFNLNSFHAVTPGNLFSQQPQTKKREKRPSHPSRFPISTSYFLTQINWKLKIYDLLLLKSFPKESCGRSLIVNRTPLLIYD